MTYYKTVDIKKELPKESGVYFTDKGMSAFGVESGVFSWKYNSGGKPTIWLKPIPQPDSVNWDELEKEAEKYMFPDGFKYSEGFVSGCRSMLIWIKQKLEGKSLGVDKGFIDYVKKERSEFELSIHGDWMSFSPEERVKMEDLLIAYDQMTDKLNQFLTKP